MMLVYEYGLLQPDVMQAEVWEQLYLAHRYYNNLIEVERDRRDAVAALTEESRSDEWKVAAKRLDDTAKERRKRLRAECGVYWGTYLLIEQAVDQASKAKAMPKFRRWNREGLLGVQFQKGLDVELLDADTRAQISPVSEEAWAPETSRGQRKALGRTRLKLRIGSDGRKPVFAEWPMVMHRPFPEGASVKWAKVIVRQNAGWPRWVVQFTLDVSSATVRPRLADLDDSETRTCAVDLGWRSRQKAGLRAAMFGDFRGCEEFQIPAIIREKLDYADSVRSIRDQKLDEMKAALVPLCKGVAWPEKIAGSCKAMHAWRAPGKFVRLVRKHAEILPAEAVDLLHAWRHRDRHLWQIETGVRRKAIRRREKIVENWAARLCERYDRIVLEDFRLTDVIPKVTGPKAPRQRVVVAPGILRDRLLNAARGRGVEVVKVNPAYTTAACHACGVVEEWDQAKLIHTCTACEESWDQDENAVQNMLALDASGHALPYTPAPLAVSKRQEVFRRAKADKAEAAEKDAA